MRKSTKLANTDKRVPSTMRAWPLCAASQALERSASVMPLCMLTKACAPQCAKRWRKTLSNCGVKLISGTKIKACAVGWACSNCDTACI